MELYQYCIGDIVRYCDKMYRVYGLDKDSDEITLEGLKGDRHSSFILSVYIGYVFPVVIDDEILESFGLTKHYLDKSYCYRYHSLYESIRLAYIKRQSSWEVKHYEGLYFTEKSTRESIRVKYLHQLQWALRIFGLKDLVYIK